MRRCQPLQSLYHVPSPPLSLPPLASSLLHLRTLCHNPSSPHTLSPSLHLSGPHNFIHKSASHPRYSSNSIPRCYEAYFSQITISPRRKFSSSPSSLLKSEDSGNLARLGTGRGVESDEEEGLDREWELEEEGEQQGQQQERQWQQPEQLQPQKPHQQEQEQQHHPEKPQNPTPISDAQYHLLADRYIDTLVSRLEEIQELREDLDCEYSAGVLEISLPPRGTYVLNKQPPNKQIWLSSPVSGPKRFDYVATTTTTTTTPTTSTFDDTKKIHSGKDEEAGNKTKVDQGGCNWIYLRDGSSLTDLLREELGVEIEVESA